MQQQQPVTLSDYLKRRQANTPDEARKQPVWLRRMQAGKLPNKDYTGKGPDAA